MRSNSTSNSNAEVGISPHTPTVRADTWVPFYKIGEGDLVVAGQLATYHAFGCEMELFTVRHHARLRRLWSLDAIACRRSRRGLRCSRGRHFCSCWSSYDANADINLRQHAGAVAADSGIPFNKISTSNLLVADDLTAAHALVNEVELVAVRNHARLRRKGCRHAVTSCCGFGAGGETCSRRPRNTNTVVSLGPEATAVIANSRVPRHKVLLSECAVFAYNLGAGVAPNRKVKVGAARDQAVLSW